MKRFHRGLAFLLSVMMLFVMSAVAMAEIGAFTVPTSYEGKTVILHTNDVHGTLEGYAYIPELRGQLEAMGAEVITVDDGDFSQGSLYVGFTKGKAAIDMMNAAGYDVVSLGNHEFDYGYDRLLENLSEAKFRTVCADIVVDATGETLVDKTAIVETASGLRIGFFGIDTPEAISKVNPIMVAGISMTDICQSAQAAVDSLRDEGVDLVIALTHLGIPEEDGQNTVYSADLYNRVKGIDFIIDGHSHTVMSKGEGGEPIQSTGTRFAYIGIVVIDNETKTVENRFLVSTRGLRKNAEVEATAKAIMEKADAVYDEVCATSEVLLNGERSGCRTGETNLGDLVADALVWEIVREGAIEQETKLQVVGLTNAGGLRASVKPGDVTMRDINDVLPFGNTLAVVYVTGEKLLEVLEASTFCTPDPVVGYPQTSGIEWTIDTTIPYDRGEVYKVNGKETNYYGPASIRRVTIHSVNGQPFDPKAVYAVATSSLCAAGGDTYNAFMAADEAGSGFDTGKTMDDVVVDYIRDALGGVITSEAYGEPHGMQKQIR
ncbi:MAG: bifunctional metallophosphatase/5'-nucleotidase [Clostridia bacterium]|nr:bifunctional metallophosphatase/5'-nucleotidase [Clostridia bacterium]